MLKRITSNAGANMVGGGVTAGYHLVLAGLASRAWHGSEFAFWALALSIASSCQLFAANLSSVVTRRIVGARHGTVSDSVSSISLAASRLSWQLAVAAVVTLFLFGLAALQTSKVVTATLQDCVILICLLLGSQVWLVMLQPRFGVQYANENNWGPAISIAIARLGGLFGFWSGQLLGDRRVLPAAAGLLVGTWLALTAERVFLANALKDVASSSTDDVRQAYWGNLRVFSGFVVWAMGSLVIQYGVPPMIAIIDPSEFSAFYLASTLNMVVLGAMTAAMSALLAPVSRWHATGDNGPILRLMTWGPMLCAGCSLIALTAVWYVLEPMVTLFQLKAAGVEEIRTYLGLQGFQTIVRMAVMGYSVALASAGTPRQMSASILIEMALSLVIAVPAGVLWGAQALSIGLGVTGFLSAAYTCTVGARLLIDNKSTLRQALGVFIISQSIMSVLWLAIVRNNI
jgi:hypothetical protein